MGAAHDALPLILIAGPAAAVASTFEPVVTLVLAASPPPIRESLTVVQLVGAALVLIGVAIAEGAPALLAGRPD